MSTYLPKDVQAGLDQARRTSLREASRLRIVTGDEVHPVLRMWKTGFAMDAETAPKLRGFVELYDGAVHLFQCLVVASEEADSEMRFEFKRLTAVSDQAALDFERRADAPVALIESGR